jgi:hypothetical protein
MDGLGVKYLVVIMSFQGLATNQIHITTLIMQDELIKSVRDGL